jgi:hypothetical protein
MPFVPAPNIISVEMRATRNGQKIENRININAMAPVIRASLEDTAIGAWDWWVAAYAPLLSTGVQLTEVVSTDLSIPDGEQFTYNPGGIVTGGIVGNSLPNESSFCISLRSNFRGRSARGRFFTLSVNQAQMADDNNLTATAAGLFVAALNTLRSNIAVGGRALSIVSYRFNNAPRPGGPVYYPVVSAVAADTLVDSQKRRKPGIGL